MKYFKTYESYKRGVNGVGSLKNSLAALKRQNINGRYVDPEILAKAVRNEYEAITGEKYEDEVQMSMDDVIADLVSHFKLDGPEFMAAWDKVVKESVTDASNNLEKIFGTDQETMDMFQGIEDKGTVKDMIEFIDEFGNEEALSRYGIKSTSQVKKLAKTIMNEAKGGQIMPGDYVKTQYGDIYQRVDGKVGGQDAYVRVTNGKAGKRKTSLHDSVKLTLVNKDGLEESVNVAEKVNLKAAHLSSAEYQKAKKLKGFDKSDWSWNSDTQLYDKINEAKNKKVTKQMWNKMSDDKRFDALLSVVKDPDDAEKYVEFDWNDLPSGFERDMTLYEKES